MASQQPTTAGSVRSPQVVGNAFVQQFFHILHQSPEHVHRFYQENSRLGRPGSQGEMSTTSSLQEINEKILSMDYSEFRAQIKTVDAQESLNGGVIVLVTGYLFGKDNVKRDFTQTFFLATQDSGYYVLNDIFRYVEEVDQQEEQQHLTDETEVPLSTEGDTVRQEHHSSEQSEAVLEDDDVNEEEVYDPSEHDVESTVEEEEPAEEVINEVPTALQPAVVDSGPSTGLEQKMSYASIVRVMKENATTAFIATSAPIRAVPTDTDRQSPAAPTQASAPAPAPAPAPTAEVFVPGSYVAESNIVHESEADGYSIYIKNLPLNATIAQLEEAFQKFGPVKPNGVQVRSNKLQGFCFGFVEFEVANAVQSAIEASPVLIGGRQAYVEEKRANDSRVNNRARFAPGRGGGFRGDGMRGRRGYGGGRGYGRGDYNNRADFGNRGGRGGGASGRGGDVGYQRVDQMGSNAARGGRSGSLPRVPAPA
ncbi:ras GTPase-activating protein-binding protein 1-like [Phalaenopsis equestris]|uniref:ras GTPase-activating protein-binding protein 1-like n=1 Tax=Phalaenopsis equestris TaxID=78828 RepID=UPI0009E45A8F|nr:ras GTPase-activating protein-binding protein 1-like [Phalaenopsis equestris]